MQSAEDSLAVVLDLAGLAVHQVLRADNLSAEGGADCLMSQAHSEQGHFAGEVADQIDTDASFQRSAGTRRDHDSLGAQGCDFGDAHLVVTANLDFGAQFSEILDEVVSE